METPILEFFFIFLGSKVFSKRKCIGCASGWSTVVLSWKHKFASTRSTCCAFMRSTTYDSRLCFHKLCFVRKEKSIAYDSTKSTYLLQEAWFVLPRKRKSTACASPKKSKNQNCASGFRFFYPFFSCQFFLAFVFIFFMFPFFFWFSFLWKEIRQDILPWDLVSEIEKSHNENNYVFEVLNGRFKWFFLINESTGEKTLSWDKEGAHVVLNLSAPEKVKSNLCKDNP